MNTSRKTLLGLFVLALVWASFSAGFINGGFTPVDLVNQSTNVLVLKIKSVDAKGIATVVVEKILKDGKEEKDKFKAKEIKIDLMAKAKAEDGKWMVERIKDGNTQAIMFVGKFDAPGVQEEGEEPPHNSVVGYVNIGGVWIETSWDADFGTWDMEKSVNAMLGVWAGGTDMLLRAVEYIRANPDQAKFPWHEDLEWDKEIHVGKIDGKVYSAQVVDLAGDGKLDLFIAAEKGDRLYQWNKQKKEFDDITAKSGLTSASHAFAWGDFNGDGRIDLASWNGKELSILSQAADGTFTAKRVDTGGAFKECLGLTTFDAGSASKKGRPAILASTNGTPVELLVQDDGSAKAQLLPTGPFPPQNLQVPGECLVADFDNDGLPDVIQLFSKGSLFYKGTGVGTFAAPVPIPVAFGAGRHCACIGDWDGDGLLDVFTGSEERNHLWQNAGGNHFIDETARSGEVAYIARSGGIFAQTSDFTNDGRQGLMVLYGDDLAPQLFFNRGFRSFGLCRKLEGQVKTAVPDIGNGQQAGYLADFNGQGAPGMMLVLKDGNIWFFPRNMQDPPLGVTIALSTASPTPGPVTIEAHNAARSFGAAVIRAGEPGQFYGAEEPGLVTVTWRFPGQPAQEKKVIIRDHAIRVLIDEPKTGPAKH